MKTGHVFRAALAFSLVLASCDSTTSPSRPLNRMQLKAAGLHMVVSIGPPGSGTIAFVIGVENGASTTQTLVFSDGQFFDIEVSDHGGEVVWRWSHDKGFTQAFWDLELAAGESYTRNTDWDLTGNNGEPVSPGSYRCRIFITCSPRDVALVYETSFTI
jgi:hypothetical protein